MSWASELEYSILVFMWPSGPPPDTGCYSAQNTKGDAEPALVGFFEAGRHSGTRYCMMLEHSPKALLHHLPPPTHTNCLGLSQCSVRPPPKEVLSWMPVLGSGSEML